MKNEIKDEGNEKVKKVTEFENLEFLYSIGRWNLLLEKITAYFSKYEEFDFYSSDKSIELKQILNMLDLTLEKVKKREEKLLEELLKILNICKNNNIPDDEKQLEHLIKKLSCNENRIQNTKKSNILVPLLVKEEIGCLNYLIVNKNKGFSLCPPYWCSKSQHAVRNSFQVIRDLFQRKNIFPIPEESDFQVDITGWHYNYNYSDTYGLSMGLPTAIAFFQKIASEIAPQHFKINKNIAATGQLNYAPDDEDNGKILGVEGIEQKVECLLREVESPTVYVSYDNYSRIENYFEKNQLKKVLNKEYSKINIEDHFKPVNKIEDVLQHLFGEDCFQILQEISNGKSHIESKDVDVYWKLSLLCDQDVNITGKQCAYYDEQQKKYEYMLYDEKQKKYVVDSQFSTNKIWKNAYELDSILPIYIDLVGSRLTEYGKQSSACKYYSVPIDSFQDEFSNVSELWITKTQVGDQFVVEINLIFRWNKLCPQDFYKFARKEFKKYLQQKLIALILKNYKGNILAKDFYRMTVLRGLAGYENTENALKIVERLPAFFYALQVGLPYPVGDRIRKNFINNNQSTRDDVFLSVGSDHTLVFETEKRKKWTEDKVEKLLQNQDYKKNKKEDLVLARSRYNDLNYFIWLEMLLRKRILNDRNVARKNLYRSWLKDWENIIM